MVNVLHCAARTGQSAQGVKKKKGLDKMLLAKWFSIAQKSYRYMDRKGSYLFGYGNKCHPLIDDANNKMNISILHTLLMQI
jgi:hypothetical protein